MVSSKRLRRGKTQMIKNMIELVKKRKVRRVRRYNERIFGKKTLRIFDLLFQLAERYSFFHEALFRENKAHLQQWSYLFFQELYQHRRYINRKKLKKYEDLNKIFKLLNCDTVIEEQTPDFVSFDRPDEEIAESVPERITTVGKRLDEISQRSSLDTNCNDEIPSHKEDFFKNVTSRRRSLSNHRLMLQTSPETSPPLSSTRMDFNNKTELPIEVSAIDCSDFSSTVDQTTILKLETSPKIPQNNKNNIPASSSNRKTCRIRPLANISNTEIISDHDLIMSVKINEQPPERNVTTNQREQHSDNRNGDQHEVTKSQNHAIMNDTCFDNTNNTFNRTHSYSLRDRTVRISYSGQFSTRRIKKKKPNK